MKAIITNLKHDLDSFSRLVGSELIDKVHHVDEEVVQLVQLLLPGHVGRWVADEDVDEVEKVEKNRVVHLLQLFSVVEFHWVQSAMQKSYVEIIHRII